MKIKSFLKLKICVLFLFASLVFSQEKFDDLKKIGISTTKGTYLVFPDEIDACYIGTNDVQIKKDIDRNILILRCIVNTSKSTFYPTNMLIKLKNNNTYYCELFYDDTSSLRYYSFEKNKENDNISTTVKDSSFIKKDTNNIEDSNSFLLEKKYTFSKLLGKEIQSSWTEKIMNANQNILGMKQKIFKVSCEVTGVYIFNQYLFFVCKVENKSDIMVEYKYIKFAKQFNLKSKQISQRDKEIIPYSIMTTSNKIYKGEVSYSIFVFNKFTIAQNETLSFELGEKNGARKFFFSIEPQFINTAKQVF